MLGNKSQVVDEWYQTAQIGNRSLEFIEYAVKVAKKPFLAYLGPHAPHYSADAPPWARDLFSDMKAPRTPAYNISVGQADKTLHVMQNPSWDVGSSMETHIDIHFRDRWRAIVGVDDLVGLVHDALKTLGVLDNTYIFFTRCVQGREMRGGSRSRARAPHAAAAPITAPHNTHHSSASINILNFCTLHFRHHPPPPLFSLATTVTSSGSGTSGAQKSIHTKRTSTFLSLLAVQASRPGRGSLRWGRTLISHRLSSTLQGFP